MHVFGALENILSLLFSVCCLVIAIKGAADVIKDRSFYKHNAMKVPGIVTAWSIQGNSRDLYFDIEIETADNTYDIWTYNIRALKYRWKKKITLLVVNEQAQFDAKQHPEFPILEPGADIPEEIIRKNQQLAAMFMMTQPDRNVIIREDLKSPVEFILCVLAACWFSWPIIALFWYNVKNFFLS